MASRVRTVYRQVLRAHRVLPAAERALANGFVRAEFKLHKETKTAFVDPFVKAWVAYLRDFERSTVRSGVSPHAADGGGGGGGIGGAATAATPGDAVVGRELGDAEYAALSDEQRRQLLKLWQETRKL